MRKMVSIIVIITFTLSANSLFAQGNAENAATDVINACKNKDVNLFKKYITGFMVYAVNDSFFESDDGKPLAETAETWDGNIKEIRYSKGDLMGKTVLLASAYFSDNPNGNINVVILTSHENSDWKAFAFGIADITKEEFEQGSKEIPEESNEIIIDHSDFSIEMASGDTYENPSIEKLSELLKSLDDENFFLILNSNAGFLQASTSEKGYIVQYSDDSGMFEAEAYFTFDMLTDIFKEYIESKEWKEKAVWVGM
jgi:hypothetical protein